MTGVGAIAAWTGPALVVAVVARVTTGGVEAPLFVLAVLAAPLLALLAGPRPGATASGSAVVIGLVTAACVLAAGFRAVVDLGHVQGVETDITLGLAVALVLVVTMGPRHGVVATASLVLGVGALLIGVVVLGLAVTAPPWTAWSRVASRGAFDLGSRSAWTRDGAQAHQPITLTFTEPHRVTATTAGVYRVTEHDRGTVVVREWRPVAGDSLTLRPGDLLSIPTGARVRFETGKRLPGAWASGVAWADQAGAPRAHVLLGWLGLVITLAGGAVAIIRPTAPLSRSAAVLAPLAMLGVVWAATCWGVYAVEAAPELSIGAPAVASLAGLGSVVAAVPWDSRLLAAVVVALLALLLASAAALRQRLVELADLETGRLSRLARRGMLGTTVWIVLVAAAAAASAWVADGWSLLLHGTGLAAATLLGPLVARGRAAGSDRARVAGALTGAVLFVALAAAAHWLAPSAVVVLHYPALIAAPGAYLVAVVTRPTRATRADKVATTRRH